MKVTFYIRNTEKPDELIPQTLVLDDALYSDLNDFLRLAQLKGKMTEFSPDQSPDKSEGTIELYYSDKKPLHFAIRDSEYFERFIKFIQWNPLAEPEETLASFIAIDSAEQRLMNKLAFDNYKLAKERVTSRRGSQNSIKPFSVRKEIQQALNNTFDFVNALDLTTTNQILNNQFQANQIKVLIMLQQEIAALATESLTGLIAFIDSLKQKIIDLSLAKDKSDRLVHNQDAEARKQYIENINQIIIRLKSCVTDLENEKIMIALGNENLVDTVVAKFPISLKRKGNVINNINRQQVKDWVSSQDAEARATLSSFDPKKPNVPPRFTDRALLLDKYPAFSTATAKEQHTSVVMVEQYRVERVEERKREGSIMPALQVTLDADAILAITNTALQDPPYVEGHVVAIAFDKFLKLRLAETEIQRNYSRITDPDLQAFCRDIFAEIRAFRTALSNKVYTNNPAIRAAFQTVFPTVNLSQSFDGVDLIDSIKNMDNQYSKLSDNDKSEIVRNVAANKFIEKPIFQSQYDNERIEFETTYRVERLLSEAGSMREKFRAINDLIDENRPDAWKIWRKNAEREYYDVLRAKANFLCFVQGFLNGEITEVSLHENISRLINSSPAKVRNLLEVHLKDFQAKLIQAYSANVTALKEYRQVLAEREIDALEEAVPAVREAPVAEIKSAKPSPVDFHGMLANKVAYQRNRAGSFSNKAPALRTLSVFFNQGQGAAAAAAFSPTKLFADTSTVNSYQGLDHDVVAEMFLARIMTLR